MDIKKLTIKNFKKIVEETYDFNQFNLLVGANNSGKSTILQAMAIWQFCIEQFRLSNRNGSRGIQVVLPNFTAVPLPEFNLLWKDKTDRRYIPNPKDASKKDQQYIYIEISLEWRDTAETLQKFGVQLRYQSPQAVYAIPIEGWDQFKALDENNALPTIVYVPPFSGIEPHEQWMDDGNIRQHVGKSQPGSVIRNLLYRVVEQDDEGKEESIDKWNELQANIEKWFGVKILKPQYTKRVSTEIKVEYQQKEGKLYDIISAGSGFHQILILLAFYFGYKGVTTILFDEPDAHLHANLQSTILQYFVEKKDMQFIMASHAPEFINRIEPHNIISILSGKPKRVQSTTEIVKALSVVDNMDIVRTASSSYILYVEGEDDARILSSWASVLGMREVLGKFYIYTMHGTSKECMKDVCETHFMALRQINPQVKRLVLMDYDGEDTFHPQPDNPCLKEWKRKNIDNYLLVPTAWKRAVAKTLQLSEDNLFLTPYNDVIDRFFEEQNLTLPKYSTWRDLKANIFSIVDGKKILFENKDSLFHQLREMDGELVINRQSVSSSMLEDELHNDIIAFFELLNQRAL